MQHSFRPLGSHRRWPSRDSRFGVVYFAACSGRWPYLPRAMVGSALGAHTGPASRRRSSILALAARLGAASLLATFLGFLLARMRGAARDARDRVMQPSPLASTILFHVGPVPITRPVVTTWAIMLVLEHHVCWLVTRRLQPHPDRRQACWNPSSPASRSRSRM